MRLTAARVHCRCYRLQVLLQAMLPGLLMMRRWVDPFSLELIVLRAHAQSQCSRAQQRE